MKWERTTIGEHCTVTSSKRFHLDERSTEGIPFYCSKEIILKNKGEEIAECDYIREEFYNEISEKFGVPQANDLLVTTRGTIGIPYLYQRSDRFYFADGNLTWMKDFQKTLSPQYLYYWFLSYEGQKQVDAIAKGTAQKAVPISGIKTLQIPLPPITTQHRIANILSAYDDLIKNNRMQIKLLEEAAQRLYQEWFVDLRFPGHEHTPITDGIPEGWKKERLVDIVDVQYGFAFDGSLFNSNGKGTPIVRIRNIPSGNTGDYTTEETDTQYIIHNRDILVGMDGEFHINSWIGDDAYLVQRTCCFRPRKEEMRGYLLQAIYAPIKFFENTVVGATVAHLGKKHIDTIMVLTGPDELYVPFQQFFDKRQLLLSQNRMLAEARDRLLPKLMNGEIEV